MRLCQLYFRGTDAYVLTQSVTQGGIAIVTDPMTRIESPSSAELGAAILIAFEASKTDVPDPRHISEVLGKLLRFLGERKWSRFARDAICVGLRNEGNTVKIVPYESAERGSFAPREDQVTTSALDAAELGQNLLQLRRKIMSARD